MDRAPPAELVACADAARGWLIERAVPLWSGAGVLPDGMFAERLDRDGRALHEPRRTRVQARQIYAFCELGRLGLCAGWRDIVEPALGLLLARGSRADGFFVHRFDADGMVLDERADLYDSAFVLFALAHAARVLDRAAPIERAEQLMRAIETRWAHPAGGFAEGELLAAPRRQNPHMHLFEATMLLWEVTGAAAWRARAARLVALCETAFIEPASGALTEFFGEDWRRAAGPEGALVEPGHCLEWSWLLESWAARGGGGTAPADRLAGFARRFGLSADRTVAIDAVDLRGDVVDAAARLWPQTERLRAALARWRRTGRDDEADEAVRAWHGLARYLDAPLPGAWRDRRRADGGWIEEPAPASSFYHIVGALAELLRCANDRRDS